MKYDRKEAREAEFTQSAASSGQTGGTLGTLWAAQRPWQSLAVIDGRGHCHAKVQRALPLHGAEVTSCPKLIAPCPVPRSGPLTPNRWGGKGDPSIRADRAAGRT